MNYLNLRVSLFRRPEFIGCEPVARATWLALLGYCVDVENGGIIPGAFDWSDRQWQQIAGVTRGEVLNSAPLVRVVGTDIVIWEFPAEKQEEVQERRDIARAAARRRWTKAAVKHQSGHERRAPMLPFPPPPNASMHPSMHPSMECGIEGEGKGKCVSGSVPADSREPETTTTRLGNSDEPGGTDVECGDRWLDRLRQTWPEVNIDREIREAEKYTRRMRGPDAVLSRRFFEREWLPRCDEPTAPQARRTAVEAPTTEPEPTGWREIVAASVYGPGGERAVSQWRDLPADVRKWVLSQSAPAISA